MDWPEYTSFETARQKLRTAIELMKAELSGLEVEYDERDVVTQGRTDGLRLGQEAADCLLVLGMGQIVCVGRLAGLYSLGLLATI